METTVKERIIAFIKHKQLSQKKFEELIGVSNGFVNNISKGIGADKLHRIVSAFPELDANWLMTGKGEMIRTAQTVGDITNSNVSGVNVNGKEIHINPDAYNTLLKIVETNQRATEKFQEQIDRLITIIEAKYGTERG